MSTVIQPKRGIGRFQWTAGGWFGSVVGSTAWMIVACGVLISTREVAVAAIPLLCFLSTNLIACALWRRREHLDPFFSLMVILGVLAVTMPSAWIGIRTWASPDALSQMNWPSAKGWNVVVLLLAPGLMIWCFILERHARRRLTEQTASDAS